MAYGQDRWLYPITIDSSNNTIEWREDPGGGMTLLTTTIAAGTYYCHNDATLNSTYPSLYIAIKAAMEAESTASALGLSYTFEAITPTSSTAQTLGGLRITSTDAWEMALFADIHKTGALGFVEDTGYLASDGSDRIDSPYTICGVWMPPEWATDKRSRPVRTLSESTEYTEHADAYSTDRGTRRIRTFIYEHITAAHVYATRGNDAGYANTGELAQYDVHNAFEALWTAWGDGAAIVVVHDVNPNTLDVIGEGYEIVKRANIEVARDFNNAIDLMITGGEYYRITLPCVITNAGDYTGQ